MRPTFFVGKVVVVGRVDWVDPPSFCNAPCLINLDSTTPLNQQEVGGWQTLPFIFFPLSWFPLDEVRRHDLLEIYCKMMRADLFNIVLSQRQNPTLYGEIYFLPAIIFPL
jgi:hypothetical protein